MTSCYGRFTGGYAVSYRLPQSRKPSRAAVISFHLRNLTTNQRPELFLRSSKRNNLYIVATATAAAAAAGERSGGQEGAGACSYSVGDLVDLTTSSERAVVNDERSYGRRVEVLVAAATAVALSVGNRVLYKLALVPLKHYPFFLAQIATFGYVAVYFSILYFRYHAGIVTDEMLSMPKAPFLAVGLMEALASVTGMAAAAILSGASIPILSQTFLVWQILLSTIFLGRRYRVNQLFGCFLVATGIILTVASGSGAGHSLKHAGIFWSLLMIVSFLFQAAGSVLKELIFVDVAQQLKGGSVDLFVVNSYGSAFQALFIFLLLPFVSKLWGIPFSQLPNYLRDGAACFLNVGSLSSGCDGAPLLPLLYVVVNMGYNIAMLHLLKISSAVASSLASTVSEPISVFMFTLPLPYLAAASYLPPGFIAGAVILVLGLLTYAWTPAASPASSCSPSNN
ncbi:Crt [Melia azedarach]|uniref:Crt n=1 Tax=Melia azedarach TaxID=155640 RepID=A0ACC1YMN8_MELAZ|nr:Crt [Melia azedarach]